MSLCKEVITAEECPHVTIHAMRDNSLIWSRCSYWCHCVVTQPQPRRVMESKSPFRSQYRLAVNMRTRNKIAVKHGRPFV